MTQGIDEQSLEERVARESTGMVERLLHNLIDAARMYEASCRLGGKDQGFASRKLDAAKSAAIAAIHDQDGLTPAMLEAGALAYGIKHQSTCYPSAADWECEDAAREIYTAMRAALKGDATR